MRQAFKLALLTATGIIFTLIPTLAYRTANTYKTTLTITNPTTPQTPSFTDFWTLTLTLTVITALAYLNFRGLSRKRS